MAKFNVLKTHQGWEDLFSAALGVLLLVSPVIVQDQLPPPVMISVLAAGVVVLALSLFEIMVPGRWEEIILFALGLWLAIAVFVLDYGAAAPLRVWHFVIGAIVAIIAAFEFWQDSRKQA